MAKKVAEKRIQNECVFEIRYKPNPKVIDNRGHWAESIYEHLHLEHWRIEENRIEIFSDDRTILFFLGFKNSGLSLVNVPNKEYFQNHVRNMLNFTFSLNGFGESIYIERIGVRCKFCTPYPGSFDNLKLRYATRYITITDKAKEVLGEDAKLIDIGGPLNFKDRIGNFNTVSGPMPQSQFPQFFGRAGEYPQVGLYFDIDYWDRPKKNFDGNQLIEVISKFFISGWDRHNRIRDLIING